MSAEIVASMDDLLIIILSKLPARSLLQFKSVSTQWRDLISSPRLAFLHFNPNAISGFFLNGTCSGCPKKVAEGQFICLQAASITVQPPLKSLLRISQDTKILHSCNGLLLCGQSYFSWDVIQVLFIYNPTLGWYIPIPGSEGMKRDLPYGFFHENHWILAFDPLKSSSYSIIFLYSSENESNHCHYNIEVYSSETGLWKLIENCIVLGQSMNLSINFSKGVFLNGVIYWPSFGCQSSFCFDVANECVKTISMPSNRLGNLCYSGFVESGGQLYYVEHLKSQCYVHVMEQSCSEWFLKYSVDMDAVLAASPLRAKEGTSSAKYAYSLLSFIHGLDDALVFYIPGGVVYYNIKKMSCRKLCDLQTCCHDDFAMSTFHGFQVHKHIETLLTLPGCFF